MLIHVRGTCNVAEQARLDAFLARSRADRSEEDVLWLVGLMQERGSIAHARKVAAAMAGAAAHEFALAYAGLPASEDLAFLQGLIRWVFDRP